MKLFEVAVILVDGDNAEIVVPPTSVLAPDIEAAKLKAGRKIPVEYDAKLSSLKVLVRPFA